MTRAIACLFVIGVAHADSSMLVAPRKATIPARLAGGNAGVEATYTRALAAFEQVAPTYGTVPRDLAGATAMYLGGAYMAFHGVQLPDAAMRALVGQMRTLLQRIPSFGEMPMADKQDMYETFAIKGTVMAVGAKDANATTRATAKGYLEDFLKTSVDNIRITEKGLELTTTTTPPAPAPTPTKSSESAPATRAPSAADAAGVVGAGLFPRNRSNGSGYVYTAGVPFLLLRSGEALLDMRALVHPGGFAGFRKELPSQVTKWRREGGQVETQQCKRGELPSCEVAYWYTHQWKVVYDPLPRGTVFEGTYRRMGGASNIASGSPGGTVAVAYFHNLTLTRAGRFSMSGSATAAAPQVARTSSSATTGGTYAIDGFVLTLKFDNGEVRHRTVVTGRKDEVSPSSLWIDGDMYQRD